MRSWKFGAHGLLVAALLASLAAPAHAQPTGSPDLDPSVLSALDAGEDGAPPHVEKTRLPPLTWRELARPEPLSDDEETSKVLGQLATRFNPAMAFPTRDIWPVEVRYGWHDGSDLRARVLNPDGRIAHEYSVLSHSDLKANRWPEALPENDADGNRVEYFVDAPGDDRVDNGLSGWRKRWRAIMGADAAGHDAPAALGYKPTQYVHFFWFNRDKGLLAAQFWFYYPYNEWINHHEGDWERINIILRGPTRVTSRANFRPVGYQFFFHHWTYEPSKVLRIRGADPREDHVVVYAGGQSRFLLWSGSTSGGSYPLPAVYPAAGGGFAKWRPPEDTSKPARFIRPEDFQVVALPEPERVDVNETPELGWLRLPFFAGQSRMFRNPLSLNGFSFGEAPAQPARQGGWNGRSTAPYWTQRPKFDPAALRLPRGWQGVVDQPSSAAEFFAARRTRSRSPR